MNVTLSATKNLWSTLPILALRCGYFSDEGLRVTINYVQAARNAMDALVSRRADMATVVTLDLALLGFSGSRNVRVLATISAATNNAIVARRSAGISRAEHLKGNRLGLLAATSSEIFADTFLEGYGLSLQDCVVERLPITALGPALIKGEVSAVSVWQPLAFALANELGIEESIVFKYSKYCGYMNIAIVPTWRDDDQDTQHAFLRALRKAEMFLRGHPQEVQRIMAAQVGFDISIVRAMWDSYDFHLHMDVGKLTKLISEESAWISRTQEIYKGKPTPVSCVQFDV